MVQEETKGKQVKETGKSFVARALGFVKRTSGWLADVVAVRKRQQDDCPEKTKSAQDVRDQLQKRCPWWGP